MSDKPELNEPLPNQALDLPEDEQDLEDMLIASLGKKKKKRTKKAATADKAAGDAPEGATEGAVADGQSGKLDEDEQPRDYTYIELLERAFKLIRINNPDSERKRYTLPHPILNRSGPRKTVWSNFRQTCEILHRSMDHVMSFVTTELNTDASIDGQDQLVIKGRYSPKQAESLLKKYIQEYVACGMCHSPDTSLLKDNVTRLFFMTCNTCNSKRSVAAIKSGFHATLRADRRLARKA